MPWQLKLTLNSVSQIAHALAGALAVAEAQVLFGPAAVWPAAAAMAEFAAVKEFWFDVHYEDSQTAGSGALDFAFYALGIALGVGGHFLARVI